MTPKELRLLKRRDRELAKAIKSLNWIQRNDSDEARSHHVEAAIEDLEFKAHLTSLKLKEAQATNPTSM